MSASRSTGPTERRARSGSPTAGQVARLVAGELGELLGREPEGVVGLARTEDGWRVGVEVLEIRRVPDTADVLAEYEVDTDARGRIQGYRRTRRYERGRVSDD